MDWKKCFVSTLPDELKIISNYVIEKTTYALDVSLLPNYTRVYLCGVNFKIVEDLCYCKPAYVESAKKVIMHVFGNGIFLNSKERLHV